VNEKNYSHHAFFFSNPPKRGDLSAISVDFGRFRAKKFQVAKTFGSKIAENCQKCEKNKRSDDADLKKINTDFYYLQKSFESATFERL
jgi:hypothetical protein